MVWLPTCFSPWPQEMQGHVSQPAFYSPHPLDLSSLYPPRYNSVLNSCCLRPDLAILPNSDLTEVQGSREMLKIWGDRWQGGAGITSDMWI